MVQARRSQQRETAVEKAEGIEKEDVGIMPLGVPMLAGPGAISTVMVLSGASKSVVTTAGVYAAIALTAFLTYVTLAAAPRVEQQLGQTGMRILTRLMGLVLCAIAVQVVGDGIKMTGLAGREGRQRLDIERPELGRSHADHHPPCRRGRLDPSGPD